MVWLARPPLGKEERKEDLGCQAIHTPEVQGWACRLSVGRTGKHPA